MWSVRFRFASASRTGAPILVALIALAGCGQDGLNTSSEPTPTSPTYSPPDFPTPSPPSPVETVRVPDPRGGVSGGGPLSGDPAAKARIDALLPSFLDTYSVDGTAALDYADRILQVVPGAGQYFATMKSGASCAISEGVIGARAYALQDLSGAFAVLLVSESQLRNFLDVIVRCGLDEILGGGPGAPCLDTYNFSATSTDGVSDRYYALVAGTDSQLCQAVRKFHVSIDPNLTPTIS